MNTFLPILFSISVQRGFYLIDAQRPKSDTIVNRAILAWCVYDWGISSFAVLITTFVFATYYTKSIAHDVLQGTAEWGYAMAIANIIVAVLSPILGAIADYNGHPKYWLAGFTMITVICSGLLWFAYPHPISIYPTLVCVVMGTIAVNIAIVFYNALLPSLTKPSLFGRVSGWGFGLGYLGGLAILFVALYGFIEHPPAWLDSTSAAQVRICGPLIALWIFCFSMPLFLYVPNRPSELHLWPAIRRGLSNLHRNLQFIIQHKSMCRFLIAQMIYIDGLNTLFAFAGIYAAGTFHMGLRDILFLGILTNAAAGIGSILLAWLNDWLGAKSTILLSLICLTLFGLGIVFVVQKNYFIILACLASLFVGSIQSSSRSLMAQLVPKEKAAALFGFYVLAGKATAFLGPWVFGVMTLHFASQRAGILAILLFFVIGGIILKPLILR